MKRIVLALLVIIVVAGLFAAVGYSGYRLGYAQGAQTAANADTTRPAIRPFDNMTPRGMPRDGFDFDYGFGRGFGRDRFPMRGFGFFSPLMFLTPLLSLALIVGLIYWLFTRSGWRFTRQTQTVETAPSRTETVTETVTETKTEDE